MARYTFGILGYGFTRPFAAAGVELTPFYGSKAEIEAVNYKDEDAFRLTGYGAFESDADKLPKIHTKISLLADALTFCEQQWVITSGLTEVPTGHDLESFARDKKKEAVEWEHTRRRSGWTILPEDWQSPSSRAVVAAKLLEQLTKDDAGAEVFRNGFYRCIEVLKLSRPYIDIVHYLQISAIELLARERLQTADKNGGKVIADFLTGLGFMTTQREWERWMQYRNALFHRGELEGSFQGKPVGLRDIPHLEVLLSDVLLKLIGCDDYSINWNRWKDRMSFTAPDVKRDQ